LRPDDSKALISAFIDSHGEELRRFLTTRVRNVADVPDVLQEVFLRMLRLPNHEAIRSPEAYFFTVAQHVAQQHALRESGMPPSVDITQMLAQLPATSDADPAMQAVADESIDAIDRALDRFSPKVRATFILHRCYGFTLQEISEHLGVSFPMVKKYLVKALMQFRQHMDTRE
jgi:RNA polymerase sigma-70 factor (ECF subfamily)